MRVLYRLAAVWLCGMCWWIAGCDQAPGPTDLNPRPPVVSDLVFSPTELVAESLPEGWRFEGDRLVGPFTAAVTATDADGEIDEVVAVLQSPLDTTPLVAEALQPAGGNRYAGTVEVSIPRGAVGEYTVLVFAVDDERRQSGELRSRLRFTATGEPPVLESVNVPDRVQRPAPGAQDISLVFSADVSDPDGLANIAQVQFWNVNAPGERIDLFDDGRTQQTGDETANDGRYSRRIFLSSDNAPGVQTFAFQATDRSGLTSEIVEVQLTVE